MKFRYYAIASLLALFCSSKVSAQAACGHGTTWTPFLNTSHATVEVRCFCSKTGQSHDDWWIQFKNNGNTAVSVNYYLNQNTPVPLQLGAHLVTAQLRAKVWGCLFGTDLFVTVVDANASAGLAIAPPHLQRVEGVDFNVVAPDPTTADESAIDKAQTDSWSAGPNFAVGAAHWRCSILNARTSSPGADTLVIASCKAENAESHVHTLLPKQWASNPDTALVRYLRNGHLANGNHREPNP